MEERRARELERSALNHTTDGGNQLGPILSGGVEGLEDGRRDNQVVVSRVEARRDMQHDCKYRTKQHVGACMRGAMEGGREKQDASHRPCLWTRSKKNENNHTRARGEMFGPLLLSGHRDPC